jgi:3-hydroxyisobutyrate dehydrogenase
MMKGEEKVMDEIIGFIGTGTMGKPMALNLLKAGFRVIAYDLNPVSLKDLKEKGAALGISCKDVASKSDVVITMLPKSEDVEKAIFGKDGVAEGVKGHSIVIDMSTIDPSVSKKISKGLAEKKVQMLDAPVSGGQKGAVAGTLTIMVGGDEATYQKCLPVFQGMGKKIVYCGQSGNGEVVKITNNLLAGITMAATAEALALGVKAGADFKTLYEVINASSGQNFSMQTYCAAKAFQGDVEPGFGAGLMAKDLSLAMNLAKEEGVPTFLGSIAGQIFSNLLAQGLGKKDYSVTVKAVEDLLKLKLRL